MDQRRSRFLSLHVAVVWIMVAAAAAAQPPDVATWKLKADQYVAYTIDGTIGVRHLGFFGYDLGPGGTLQSEPKHPAFLSLALVTRLPPGRPKKGMKVSIQHTFTRFEAYTPVRVSGTVTVTDVIGPLLFLRGAFRLGKVRAQGKDGRFYQITKGELAFESQFDMNAGLLREAAVKFTYTYDVRVPLEQLYSGAGMKQDRNVKVDLPHIYSLTGVIAKEDMQGLIDAWIDEKARTLLEEWGGTGADGHNYALKPGYDSLYVLALLHAKVPKRNEVLQKVMARIRQAPIRATYAAALVLMVLEAMNTPDEELQNPEAYRNKPPKRDLSADDRKVVERAVRYLIRGQLAGGWTYVGINEDRKFFPTQTGDADASNSQFAIMGLHAAARMGARIDARVWRRALGYWQRNLSRHGFKPKGHKDHLTGWGYALHGRGTPYLAMTAGGLASLSIIRAGLGLGPGDRSRDGTAVDRLTGIGRSWLENFYSVRQCRRAVLPGPTFAADWAYHLYALERAMDLGRIQKIGRHDWYLEGAMAILNDTYEDIGRDHVFEALCILFLERSTPPAVTEPVR